MKNSKQDLEYALINILEWSKTFYQPIIILPLDVQYATASLYLSLRALDEIEDSVILLKAEKITLLSNISIYLQTSPTLYKDQELINILKPFEKKLPKVTMELPLWLSISPTSISSRINESVSVMAFRMSYWVENDFQILTKENLVNYSYAVGGTVAITLTDIWGWYGVYVDRTFAVEFGFFLQVVNILRGEVDDRNRKVNFFPLNWNRKDMISFAHENLNGAKEFVKSISNEEILKAAKVTLKLSTDALFLLENNILITQDGINKP
jgi:farnesyl-diphosphate farnesyltransferase